jgi:FtsP/CotA-like multicopper oxidase with cupredoxin domain
MNPSRRQMLAAGTAGALWLGAGCSRKAPAAPADRSAPGPDVGVVLRAAAGRVTIDPRDPPAGVLRFEGTRLFGPADALSGDGPGYLGPTFRMRRGQRLRVELENRIDEPSIVHWHGLDVAPENDGHPRFAVASGERYRYEFPIENRPGTYWYHAHPEGRTGYQVYAGMAGLFLVVDDDDRARGLPAPEFDLPLLIQDRDLTGGELRYAPNTMVGALGDRIVVNGRPEASIDVRAGSYRLRLVNGSNARIYKLAWSDASPMRIIASDGGLLAAPVEKPYVMLGPGERVEVWANFGQAPREDEVWLESQTFADSGGMGMMGGMGMGRGMMGGAGAAGSRLPQGAAFRVCRFSVRGKGSRLPLPRRLSPVEWRPPGEVTNAGRPRRFSVSMAMMRFLLNGRTFGLTEVADNERIKLGTTEDWEFENPGGMMTLTHPIHLHGGQFQVVERAVAPAWRETADTMGQGLVDEGWKDTFLLRSGERVRIRVHFARHAGLYLYHCHNLEHEDMGMMRNFLVEA